MMGRLNEWFRVRCPCWPWFVVDHVAEETTWWQFRVAVRGSRICAAAELHQQNQTHSESIAAVVLILVLLKMTLDRFPYEEQYVDYLLEKETRTRQQFRFTANSPQVLTGRNTRNDPVWPMVFSVFCSLLTGKAWSSRWGFWPASCTWMMPQSTWLFTCWTCSWTAMTYAPVTWCWLLQPASSFQVLMVFRLSDLLTLFWLFCFSSC